MPAGADEGGGIGLRWALGREGDSRASEHRAPLHRRATATRGGPARTHFATVGRSLAAELAQPLELVGAGARRRCTVGLPPSTEVASSSNSRSSEPCSERCSSLDRTWHGLTVRAAARVHRWRQLGPNQPQLCPTTNNFGLENRFNA